MSTDDADTGIGPMKRYLGVVGAIMLVTIGIGLFLTWGEGESGYLIPAIWIGFALSVIYLLSEITSSVEKHRLDS